MSREWLMFNMFDSKNEEIYYIKYHKSTFVITIHTLRLFLHNSLLDFIHINRSEIKNRNVWRWNESCCSLNWVLLYTSTCVPISVLPTNLARWLALVLLRDGGNTINNVCRCTDVPRAAAAALWWRKAAYRPWRRCCSRWMRPRPLRRPPYGSAP